MKSKLEKLVQVTMAFVVLVPAVPESAFAGGAIGAHFMVIHGGHHHRSHQPRYDSDSDSDDGISPVRIRVRTEAEIAEERRQEEQRRQERAQEEEQRRKEIARAEQE